MRQSVLPIVFLLVACSNLKTEAQEQVAAQLKDPSSAQFRDLRVAGHSLVCGEVNGKNSFGAYNGFKKFSAIEKGDSGEWIVMIESDDLPSSGGVISTLCKNAT